MNGFTIIVSEQDATAIADVAAAQSVPGGQCTVLKSDGLDGIPEASVVIAVVGAATAYVGAVAKALIPILGEIIKSRRVKISYEGKTIECKDAATARRLMEDIAARVEGAAAAEETTPEER